MVSDAVIRPTVDQCLFESEMRFLRPQEHLLMGVIEFLEFFCIASHIRVVNLGQLFVSGFDSQNMAVREEFFEFEFKKFNGLALSLREPRLQFSIRFD